MKNTLFGALMCLLLFSACNSPKESTDLLILNATVLDVETGKEMPGKMIAISGDTIRAVLDIEESEKFTATKVIDAENQYVMPGLWDMHVHFRGGDTLVAENKDLLPLFLAYGVTTVRDAGGDITQSVLDWRQKINSGELDGPAIFTSGPKLDGPEPAWDGSIEVAGLEDIPAALDSLEQLKVDYVKMYDGSLTKEVFYGIIAAAEERGLKTTGHMPMSADILKGVDLGLDGSEHLYYVMKACSPKADSLTRVNPGYGMMDEIIDTYDPQLAQQVFQKLKENKVFVTPTLHIGKTLSEILDVDHSTDSLLPYISSGLQKTYGGRIEGAKRARASGSTMREKMEEKSLEMIKPMYDSGVPLMAGSDCGAFNSYVYPGGSLHNELERLVAAGLTPIEAIKTSVINGPAFFGLENSYGSIEPGKMADLLILNSNPFENIEKLREVSYVLAKGEIYEQEKLREMMQAVKQ
ncbi:amidohydrolase family protein [Salinimicrobium terrae]|uniref:amidohydrolase family protein n=1 Tax=Salinimicrobium terrae TaxID=470866 RepID=UPI000422BBA6|nr:amidohydrolase family protein [Salinimicrobium terrae]